ncbi:uncharacterized protein FOMMEDRAFT_30622 [Fomitiporia mediterranea MF3/22]|uniref:uncharacterized protein n=1 Tax=Fomitiporia mediterranea (strain MF3/22) TaxID=694068 RepID=UPI0004407966|nr:uncharacterized protein FOMMEDRAFT_30622 [Fomitiporia mediterranea MF3/22]EJD00655.1 hypothetical protein FOMMEDRAFT_30622 [Fomitiporia mediterranea MF3/22]
MFRRTKSSQNKGAKKIAKVVSDNLGNENGNAGRSEHQSQHTSSKHHKQVKVQQQKSKENVRKQQEEKQPSKQRVWIAKKKRSKEEPKKPAQRMMKHRHKDNNHCAIEPGSYKGTGHTSISTKSKATPGKSPSTHNTEASSEVGIKKQEETDNLSDLESQHSRTSSHTSQHSLTESQASGHSLADSKASRFSQTESHASEYSHAELAEDSQPEAESSENSQAETESENSHSETDSSEDSQPNTDILLRYTKQVSDLFEFLGLPPYLRTRAAFEQVPHTLKEFHSSKVKNDDQSNSVKLENKAKYDVWNEFNATYKNIKKCELNEGDNHYVNGVKDVFDRAERKAKEEREDYKEYLIDNNDHEIIKKLMAEYDKGINEKTQACIKTAMRARLKAHIKELEEEEKRRRYKEQFSYTPPWYTIRGTSATPQHTSSLPRSVQNNSDAPPGSWSASQTLDYLARL